MDRLGTCEIPLASMREHAGKLGSRLNKCPGLDRVLHPAGSAAKASTNNGGPRGPRKRNK
jgi:hypothetical protein